MHIKIAAGPLLWSGLTFLFAANACRTAEEISNVAATADDGMPFIGNIDDSISRSAEGTPADTLATANRQVRLLSSACGYDTKSTVKPLLVDFSAYRDQKVYFTENIWRDLARPTQSRKCQVGEILDSQNGWCVGSYGLQFYPRSKAGSYEHFLAGLASPLIRVIARDSYPDSSSECAFTGDGALMYVAGIRNHFLGETWKNTDLELLSSLLAWNRNSDAPVSTANDAAGHDKLKALPAYIQIVGNKNSVISGIRGLHEEEAIDHVAANLELAFRAGIKHMEIVSHSNGMISAQIGLTVFARRLERNGADWTTQRLKANPGAGAKMKINLYHLQAAPSQKWTFFAMDKHGSYSDFLPNAKWVKRTIAGITYDGWEWDFSVYKSLDNYTNLAIRYYYNAVDTLTFPWFSTTVGRKTSLAWHKEVDSNGSTRGVQTLIRHYTCSSEKAAECGPAHNQRRALWDFSHPGFIKNKIPMLWEIERDSGLFFGRPENFGRPVSTGKFDESRLRVTSFVPEAICVDVRKHSRLCQSDRNQFNSRLEIPVNSMPEPLALPKIICASLKDIDSPCSTATCGDNICSFGEENSCATDCNLPKKYRSCVCNESSCANYEVTCIGPDCSTKLTSAQAVCSCTIDSDEITCAGPGQYCELARSGADCTAFGAAKKLSSIRPQEFTTPEGLGDDEWKPRSSIPDEAK